MKLPSQETNSHPDPERVSLALPPVRGALEDFYQLPKSLAPVELLGKVVTYCSSFLELRVKFAGRSGSKQGDDGFLSAPEC